MADLSEGRKTPASSCQDARPCIPPTFPLHNRDQAPCKDSAKPTDTEEYMTVSHFMLPCPNYGHFLS